MGKINAPDLTKCPPRSPRVRIGQYVILARCLDKGRATIENKNGEYHYNCPLDQQFMEFAGINADALKEQLTLGKGDGEILEWINQNSKTKPAPWEIAAWSSYYERRAPSEIEFRRFIDGIHSKVAPHRKDIMTIFDILDLDDYASYGGKP